MDTEIALFPIVTVSHDRDSYGPDGRKERPTILSIVEAYATELVTTRKRPNVKTVCRKAEVSRPTFYTYFEGIDDLDTRFLSVLYYQRFTQREPVSRDLKGLQDFLVRVFAFVERDGVYFHAFLNMSDFEKYTSAVRDVVRSEVLRLFPNLTVARFPTCHVDLIVSVLMTALSKATILDRSKWESLAADVIDFTFGGFAGLERHDSLTWNREKVRILRVISQTRRLVSRVPSKEDNSCH